MAAVSPESSAASESGIEPAEHFSFKALRMEKNP